MSCRVAAVFMSRRGGMPVNRLNHPVLDGAISVDDLDVGVGIFGASEQADLRARLGIYQFDLGKLVFRHAISFDSMTGFARKRLVGSGNPRELLQADCAMVNWIRPLLFFSELPPGGFLWKPAPRVPWEELDPESHREYEDNLEFSRSREFFGSSRRSDALLEMFNRYVEHSGDISALEFPEKKTIAVMPNGSPAGTGDSVDVPLEEVRRMAMFRFAAGLKVRKGNFHDHCGAFARAFRIIGQMVKTGSSMTSISVKRFFGSVVQGGEAHLEKIGLEQAEIELRMKMVRSAAGALELLASAGKSLTVPMRIQTKECPVDAVAFDMVRPKNSVQLVEKESADSHFPEEGEKFFQ